MALPIHEIFSTRVQNFQIRHAETKHEEVISKTSCMRISKTQKKSSCFLQNIWKYAYLQNLGPNVEEIRRNYPHHAAQQTIVWQSRHDHHRLLKVAAPYRVIFDLPEEVRGLIKYTQRQH
jgi:hypothetical protein